MNIINIPYISYKRGRDILIKEDLPRAAVRMVSYFLCDAFMVWLDLQLLMTKHSAR